MLEVPVQSQKSWRPVPGWPGRDFSHSFLFFRPSVDWRGPLLLGKAVCCTQSADSNVINLIQKPLPDTPRETFDHMSGHPVGQSSWHVNYPITEPKLWEVLLPHSLAGFLLPAWFSAVTFSHRVEVPFCFQSSILNKSSLIELQRLLLWWQAPGCVLGPCGA